MDQWMSYLHMLADIKDIKFSRSLKTEGTDPNIDLEFCTFNNGNPYAMGTASYMRWQMLDGSFKCQLMMAKV